MTAGGTLGDQILAIAVRSATEDKAIYAKIGPLVNLTTTAKNNIVNAINEIAARNNLDDTATSTSTTKTYSANKISQLISTAVAGVLGMPPSDLDTLQEIAARLMSNESGDQAVVSALGKRVRVDAAQTFTTAEQLQGRDNLGGVYSKAEIGDLATLDPVAVFNSTLAS